MTLKNGLVLGIFSAVFYALWQKSAGAIPDVVGVPVQTLLILATLLAFAPLITNKAPGGTTFNGFIIGFASTLAILEYS